MDTANQNALGKALAFLERLEGDKIWYRLERIRDSLMVLVAVPGQYWEVEFFEDGHVEVERFISTGGIRYEDELGRLLKEQEDANRQT